MESRTQKDQIKSADAILHLEKMTLAYLCVSAPSIVTDELMRAGHAVWEALSVSEILHLCEYHHIDVVVIAAGVDDAELPKLRAKRITIQLEPEATAADIIWELSVCFDTMSNSPNRIH